MISDWFENVYKYKPSCVLSVQCPKVYSPVPFHVCGRPVAIENGRVWYHSYSLVIQQDGLVTLLLLKHRIRFLFDGIDSWWEWTPMFQSGRENHCVYAYMLKGRKNYSGYIYAKHI